MKKINRPLLTMVSVAALLAGCENMGAKKHDSSADGSQLQTQASQAAQTQPQLPQQQHYNNLWDRIRAGYSLPDANNPVIDSQVRFYTSNKNYFAKVALQSEPYLHYVVTQLQANNMPLELALLPFLESAYNPAASNASNAGMWQLGFATGKNYGLKTNAWYDGRKDVVASTDAAIRLLNKLNTLFDGDWLLVVAAYNAGEGTIQQAIEKNRRTGKPTDFWSLPLNKTTQGYVPQLLALSRIVANPQRYDFQLPTIADTPYFVKINVDSQINLAEAAQTTSLDLNQLKKLNAGFNGWLTDPTGQHQVLVPVADAAAFTLKLDTLSKGPKVKWSEYVVKKGDSLDAIAKKYGVSSTSISTTNRLGNNKLTPGQRLQIALTPNASATDEKIVAVEPSPVKQTGSNTYVVKSGENLWTIAKAQKMSVNNLAQLNGISTNASLQPGQKLVVSVDSQANSNQSNKQNATTDAQKLNYSIKSGDTLGKIAAQYKVTVKQIMQWNNIKDETNLRPQQELVIYAQANP